MKRYVGLNEISDGKLYDAASTVKIGVSDCKGCSKCCRETDDTIHLDAFDIYLLSKGTGHSFTEFLNNGYIGLTVVDSVITPYLAKKDEEKACVFLNTSGRCSVHAFRPGFCRLFPLGRVYSEDGAFKYFIQTLECPYPVKTDVKVSDWLGIEDLNEYEGFIKDWHGILQKISSFAGSEPSEAALKGLNIKFLNLFFLTPYDTGRNFYAQFSERMTLFDQV